MVQPIYYSSQQAEQIDGLKAYIEEYCQANNINPAVYTSALDSRTGFPPDILNDPVFQAYWKLAYLQLMEIIDPALVQSLYGQVGAENFDFDHVYSMVDPEFNAFLEKLVVDDPELMAFLAQQDGNPETSPEAILEAISRLNGTTPMETYVNEDARRMIEELGVDSGLVNAFLYSEEGAVAMEQSLLMALAEMDSQLAELRNALRSGEMNADEFNAVMGQISSNRQIYISMLGDIQGNLSNMATLYSNLLKTLAETTVQIIRNWNIGA